MEPAKISPAQSQKSRRFSLCVAGGAGLRVRAECVEQAEEQNDRAERRREQRRHRPRRGASFGHF
ncbi:MAG: hypothetical protein ACLUI3_01315 [Christensenellales bacterium]